MLTETTRSETLWRVQRGVTLGISDGVRDGEIEGPNAVGMTVGRIHNRYKG